MTKKCIGCGITMQYDESNKVGYSPKKDALYCQRCFRLINYGEFKVVGHNELENEHILSEMSKHKGTILWVVDLFDFESCLIDGLNKYFKDVNLIVVITKCDLLPETLTQKRIIDFANQRLKDYGIISDGIITTSLKDQSFDVFEKIKKLSKTKDIMVVGMANAGKSTLLNKILDNKQLTSSFYPNTTISFNAFEKDGYKFIDTPGLTQNGSMLQVVKQDDLKYIIPIARIKPRIYQIYEDQSFALGGLLRIDIKTKNEASVVFYTSNVLNIHRGKLENASELWKRNYGSLLIPTLSVEYEFFKHSVFKPQSQSFDLVVFGLGWIKIDGDIEEVKIYHHENIKIIERKETIKC